MYAQQEPPIGLRKWSPGPKPQPCSRWRREQTELAWDMSGDHTHTRLVVDHTQGTVHHVCMSSFILPRFPAGLHRLHGRLLYLWLLRFSRLRDRPRGRAGGGGRGCWRGRAERRGARAAERPPRPGVGAPPPLKPAPDAAPRCPTVDETRPATAPQDHTAHSQSLAQHGCGTTYRVGTRQTAHIASRSSHLANLATRVRHECRDSSRWCW